MLIVGFVDDIAIVLVAKTVKKIEGNSKGVLDRVGILLVAHKMEIVLLSNRKIVEKIKKILQLTRRGPYSYPRVIIDDSLGLKKKKQMLNSLAERVL